MNYRKVIKNNFKFLQDSGYKRKIYSYIFVKEYMVRYTNRNLSFEINYALCNSPNNTEDIEELLETSYYSVWVVIQCHNKRYNLLNCDLLDKLLLKELEQKVEGEFLNNLEGIIISYAQFIKNNLNKLEIISQ